MSYYQNGNYLGKKLSYIQVHVSNVQIEIRVLQFQVFEFTSGYGCWPISPLFLCFFLAISISIFNIIKYYFYFSFCAFSESIDGF